jgi:hypothetical protein
VRIHGQIASGWNYAITPQASIEAGKLYRLSAWVRVDRLGTGTPRPFFKCEFMPGEPGKTLGQVQTESYEGPLGEWRQLAGEFLVPEGAKACWLALEKGTSGAAEIDALMSDVRLEPIPRLTVLDRYRLAPLPAPLEKLRGVITGMAAAGLALFDEVDEGAYWIGLPVEKYRRTMAALGSDGASHEGVGYWEYGVEYMLKFMAPARTLLDVDLYDHPWWRNTAAYALYLSLPRNAWRPGNCVVDLADCPRGHWYGPEYLLAGLARQYRDGHAQWLAEQVRRSGTTAPSASWLNLVWHDETVPAMPPTTLPTLRHFDDMGIVSARSDWSGDESLVVFKCGPFIGHKGVAEGQSSRSHGGEHPSLRSLCRRCGSGVPRRPGPEAVREAPDLPQAGRVDRGRRHRDGQRWSFSARGCTATLDWSTGKVQ